MTRDQAAYALVHVDRVHKDLTLYAGGFRSTIEAKIIEAVIAELETALAILRDEPKEAAK